MNGYIGEIKIFAFGFAPSNFMLCDGRRLNKNTYSKLYRMVGDRFTYDRADTTTFAIPDLRDRFVRQPESESALGRQSGADEVVLTMDQMPQHNHQVKLEVDNTSGGEEVLNTPANAYLNNQAGVFSQEPSEDAFLGELSQKEVGNATPVPVKNRAVKMVYAIRYRADDVHGFLGQLTIWPNANPPRGWKLCNGASYSFTKNPAFTTLLGFKYGEDNQGNPKLPDFRERLATGAQTYEEVGQTGGNTRIRLSLNQLPGHTHDVKLAVNNEADSAHTPSPSNGFINRNAGRFSQEATVPATLGGIVQENRGGNGELDITNPATALNYIICVEGVSNPNSHGTLMGEIIPFAGVYGNARDHGLNYCDGQPLSMASSQQLFSLIRNTYGGNGKTSFKLPDLKSRIPLCCTTLHEVGQTVGANEILLSAENLPEHNHDVKLAVNAVDDGQQVNIPNAVLNKNAGPYSTKPSENTYLAGVEETPFVGEKVDIRNPFLTINYLISIDGIYPNRNETEASE